jgi:GntR family transcriptional regulator, transcriptional repressor for pyruvate dehydrogenase complex
MISRAAVVAALPSFGGTVYNSITNRPGSTNLTDHLAHQVLELIRTERFVAGDRLPPVKRLAELFSVAAPTIREALRRLEVTGIIEIRHGSGIYVLEPEGRMVLSNPYAGVLDQRAIVDLLNARRVIEPPVAALAAVHATDDQLRHLSALLDRAEGLLAAPKIDDIALSELNMQFHSGIAAAGGNTVLRHLIESLANIHFKEQLAVMDLYDDRREDHRHHQGILAALAARDAEDARLRMDLHVANVLHVVATRLEEVRPN